MTKDLFTDDAYIKECQAKVISINADGGIILDQTIFYPTGGGQPGDSGMMVADGNIEIKINTAVKDKTNGEIIHIPEENQPTIKIGANVTAKIDWDKRLTYMRMHSAMHILCAVVPCGVTGGQVGYKKSRLDFDIGEHSLDKIEITAAMNKIIAGNQDITAQWISDSELDANPDLIRTMSVKPPRYSGKIRLLKIGADIDLQPCGGTHVINTSEIGEVIISKIENKGKRNRRVNIVFA